MSASGTPGRRLPSERDYIPRLRDLDPAQQQIRLRERQKFFEDVFQHEVDFFYPLNHLNIEHRRPPLDSISSMEVNVDNLEQIETFDTSDQDSLDVFLGCTTEDETDMSSLSDFGSYKDETFKSCLAPLSTDLMDVDRKKGSEESSSHTKIDGHDESSPITNGDQEAKSQ